MSKHKAPQFDLPAVDAFNLAGEVMAAPPVESGARVEFDRDILTLRFACTTPAKMDWRAMNAAFVECRGCGSCCGCQFDHAFKQPPKQLDLL